jgi:hypothetical protein
MKMGGKGSLVDLCLFTMRKKGTVHLFRLKIDISVCLCLVDECVRKKEKETEEED